MKVKKNEHIFLHSRRYVSFLFSTRSYKHSSFERRESRRRVENEKTMTPLRSFAFLAFLMVFSSTGTTRAAAMEETTNLINDPFQSTSCLDAQMYCEQTNRKEIENIDFYLAYNFFRLAGILQGILGRVRDGTAASEHAEAQSDRVRPLAEAGWEYAKKAGAI